MKNTLNKYKELIYKILPVCLLTTITLVMFAKIAFSKGLAIYMDTAPYNITAANLSKFANFTWNEHYAGIGTSAIRSFTDYFFISKIYLFINFFTKNEFINNTLWVILPYLALTLTLYFVFQHFIKSRLSSFLMTALFLTTHVYKTFIIISGSTILSWGLTGDFWFVYFYDRFIEEDKKNKKYIILLLGGLSSILAVTNIAYFYTFILLIGILFVSKLITEPNKIKKIITSSVIFGLNTVIFNLFWLFPVKTMLSGAGLGYGSSNDYLLQGASACASYLTNFRLSYCSFNNDPAIIFSSLLLLFVFLFALFFGKKNKTIFSWSLVFASLFPFSLGLYFSGWSKIAKIPGNIFLRFPQRFYFILIFSMLLVIGKLLAITKNKIFYLACVIILIINSYILLITNNPSNSLVRTPIPVDYKEVSEITNKNEADRVLVLPKTDYLPAYKWEQIKYVSSPVIDFYLNNRLFIYFIFGDNIPQPAKSFYTNEFYQNPLNFKKIFGFYNIRYVLYQNDFSSVNNKTTFEPNEDKINNILSDSKKYDGDNLKLYEIGKDYLNNQFYLPEKVIKYSDAKEINPLVSDEATKSIALTNEPDVSIGENKKTTLDFKRFNPTKYSLSIKNLQNRTLLVFSESFNNGWTAKDSKTFKKIDTHLLVNGYANGWTLDPKVFCKNNKGCELNPDGSYNINLSVNYSPQNYFLIGSLVSIVYSIYLLFLIRRSNENI